jgi:enterochelin esterase family protein
MKNLCRWLLRAAAFALSGLSLFAADPVVISPESQSDGHVTLRFLAPNAQAVSLQGLSKEAQPMTKDADGVWSITVGPLAPDFYSYTFSVDGATVTDPRNRNVKKWIRSESAFEVKGEPPTLGTFLDVPHGVVHRHVFFSKSRQRENAIQVYTPPGFDPRGAAKYPVLYLLHGFGDDETAWIEPGRANYIADNLLAKHLTVPAVIVMTNGHPVPIPLAQRPSNYSAENNAAMERELLDEVIPLVEKNYPVKTDAANRAIAGLSMGGGHSLNIGLTHLDRFGWIGGFSSGAPTDDLDKKFAALAESAKTKSGGPKLVWIAVGKNDFLLEQNKKFVGWLEAQHIPHTWTITEGAHEWPVWRRYLGEFLPLLFRQ